MRLRSIVTGLALVQAGLLALQGSAFGQTKKFTLDADFDTGTLNNVAHLPVANQLILGRTPVSKTNIVWSTNYRYGYVVRLDTLTGKQTGRFDSALVTINGQATGARPAQEYCDFGTIGNCPGRVAVDTNGDVWIVNRAFGHQGSLSKFSGNIAHCIDRNNNGVIDTSHDVNNDGLIDVNPAAGEYFGQNDECILTTIAVGPGNQYPRGVAVDKYGKIWVSTFNDGKIYRYNPNEPVTLEATVNVGGNPYSLASGGDYVFISKSGGPMTRINITTLAVNSVNAGCVGQGTYGVVADPTGIAAWAGGWFGPASGTFKFDFVTNTCSNWGSNGSNVTAVTLDFNNNIWACGYDNASVFKYSPAGVLLGTYPAGGTQPHGMSIDFQGNLWVVTHGPAQMVKINSTTGAIIGKYTIGGPGVPDPDPYLYSDFTGVQIDRQAPYTYVGSWDGTYDGQVPNLAWSKVTWNTEAQGAVPAQTSLVVSARAANSLAALGTAGFTPVVNNAAIPGVVGRYIQVRTDLKGPGFLTPVLSDITVTGPCPNPGQNCCIVDGDCSDGNVCTLDSCPVPGGACVHGPAPNCCLTAADCNDQNPCTNDSCPVPGGACTFAPKANCCNSNAECNDNNLCTADICSGPGGTCAYPIINGCCNTDIDCTKGNACSGETCPVPGGFCQGGPIAGCCTQDSDCVDNDLCTLDVCNVATKTCANTPVQGCCNVDGNCNDNNECTSDHCSGPGGTCIFTGIPGCCSPNDPMVGKACDIPMSPFDKLPCKPGHFECTNGVFQCVGAVKPGLEVCNGVDDNCDGVIDSPPPCPVGSACIEGVCAKPCDPGEFACPGGEQCVNGYCLPTSCDLVVCPEGLTCFNGVCLADGGMSTSSSSSGSTTTTTTSGAGGAGGSMTGAGGAGGISTTTSTTATASSSSGGIFGLATGGGGCKCSLPGTADDAPARMGLALAALGLAALRRRRSR
jgi:MYXO-CTERM domain-containing protein